MSIEPTIKTTTRVVKSMAGGGNDQGFFMGSKKGGCDIDTLN
jgi:hypothetical protein